MKKSNDRSWFFPKRWEDGQSLDFVESIKARKHMKGRDKGKARSTARNSFIEQTCSMEGAFPNRETVKGQKSSTTEMRSEAYQWSQPISQTRLVRIKSRFQIVKSSTGREYRRSQQRREWIYGQGSFHNPN